MEEVPLAREHHGHAVLVGGGDQLVVAQRSAGLDDHGHACRGRRVESVAEGIEGVSGRAPPLARPAAFLAA